MKVRTTIELQDALDNDLSWRKREFTTIKFMVEKESRNHLKVVLYRTAIALLYSHWEGHVKLCAIYYLNFISHLGKNLDQLTDNFSQIFLAVEFQGGFSIKSIDNQKQVHDYFQNLSNKKFKVKGENTINTESNLNFEALEKVINQLNLDITNFVLKEKFINEKLLTNRNKICHGELVAETDLIETYNGISENLLMMIEEFNGQIIDSVINKKYLKT